MSGPSVPVRLMPLAVRENFPAGMRFSGGKHQFDPFIDGNGTQRLLPLLLPLLFHGGRQ